MELPTFSREIKNIERLVDAYDLLTIKTSFDKSKLPLNREYIKSKMVYYDKTVLLPDSTAPVSIASLVGTKPEYTDLETIQCILLSDSAKLMTEEMFAAKHSA